MLPKGAILSGRYYILSLIGAGGFGSVYRARDRKTKATVAVKVLSDQFARDTTYIKRFHREALIARSLASPHVIRVLGSGEDRDTHYLVMELVEGLTLRDVLHKEGALPPAEAVAIAADATEAIAEAHRQGVIHRDIKPENIFVTAQTIKLGDFGIASAEGLGSLTSAYHHLGTAAYGSPEQLQGREMDRRSDIYSLGVVLYEMLEGHMPFSGTPLAVMDAHLHDEPRFHRTKGELADIVSTCMAKSPDDRYQDADALGVALAAVRGDANVTAAWAGGPPSHSLPTQTVRMERRPRRLPLAILAAAVSAVAIVATAVVLAVTLFGGSGNARPGVTGSLLTSATAATEPGLVSANDLVGEGCPSTLDEGAPAFVLPASEPERSVAAALNCGNATFVQASALGDPSLLTGALTGAALDSAGADIARSRDQGYTVIPSTVELLSIHVTSPDTAEVSTTETWTKVISGSGERCTSTYPQTYALTRVSGRWLIQTNDVTGAATC